MIHLNLPERLSEENLIRKCIEGDRKSQKFLYERYAPKLYSVCMRYAPESMTAEDILQEGFVKAFNSLSSFRFEGSFEGWLRRIIVNTAIEFHRRKNNLYSLVEADNYDVEYVDENALSMLLAEDLMNMIATLSPGYRTVFNLYVIDGYSHKEIAEQLNISEGTSKSQLARARYYLMDMVEKRTGVKRKAIGE